MQSPPRAANVTPTTFRRLRPLLLGILAVALLVTAPGAVRWADVNLLGEAVRDAWGQWRWREDWATAPALPVGQADAWLATGHRPVWVAHALGDSGGAAANTLASLKVALQAGFKMVEVDLWLDSAHHLRCHHGPEPPAPFRHGDCEFRDVLAVARDAGAHVIVDLKTDFESAGSMAVREAAVLNAAPNLVFQLYRPTDVAAFVGWARQVPLPGPLITAYLSHRSLDHLATHAERIGAKGLVVPLHRLAALGRVPGMALAVHPLVDCAAVAEATARGASALFISTPLLLRTGGGCLR